VICNYVETTTWRMTDQYMWLVKVAMEVLATPCSKHSNFHHITF
jgi:hypothetical protein